MKRHVSKIAWLWSPFCRQSHSWLNNSEKVNMLEANVPRSWAISSELQKAASVQKNLVIYISISKLDTIKESDICPWVSNWPHNMTHFVQDLNSHLTHPHKLNFAIMAVANVVTIYPYIKVYIIWQPRGMIVGQPAWLQSLGLKRPSPLWQSDNSRKSWCQKPSTFWGTTPFPTTAK